MTHENVLPARTRARWVLLAFGVPFFVYALTVAPTVWWLDSAELTTGAYTLGIVHAPGSPSYLLLGHLFTKIPLGDIGYRLNLMSVCAGAGTALLVYLTIQHLTRQHLLALATSWYLAFSYYVWAPAVVAELYALQGTFVAGLFFLALKWREQQRPWQLLLLAVLFGLGLGNHLSLVLLLPGLALLTLSTSLPWRKPRWLLLAALGGVAGAAVYVYLPLRFLADPGLNYAGDYWNVDLASWSGFWWMVSGRMFESLFFAVPMQALPREVFNYLYYLWSNFVGLGLLVGLWGLMSDFRHRPVLHLSLLLMFLCHLTFYVPYAAPDQSTMLVPSYLIWGVWFGIGIHRLSQRFPFRTTAADNSVWPVLVLALMVSNLILNFRYADRSNDWSARERGEEIFAALETDAIFLGSWIDVPILEYLQIVEGQRPDIKHVNLLFTSDEQEASMIVQGLSDGTPVYTSWAGLLAHMGFEQLYHEDCRCFRMIQGKNLQEGDTDEAG